MAPNLLYLHVEVEQFVFQEVGVEGHEWAGRGGGEMWLWSGTGWGCGKILVMPHPQHGCGHGNY